MDDLLRYMYFWKVNVNVTQCRLPDSGHASGSLHDKFSYTWTVG